MMRKFISIFAIWACMPFVAGASELSDAIANVRTACGGISNAMSELKTMAGINTAVTSVGTVASGVAFGAGIAKSNVDNVVAQIKQEIAEIGKIQSEYGTSTSLNLDRNQINGLNIVISNYLLENTDKQYKEMNARSKTLGNIRTGTMAGAAATNIAGAVIAGTNRVKGDLQQQINECIVSTKKLSVVRMQARANGDADNAELDRAEKIVIACQDWEIVDVSKINDKAKGAMISSAVGATTGIAGTVTSAMANQDSTRDYTYNSDDYDEKMKKEKNLNTASNVLAGTTTVASGVATVFNATQIGAIKRAVSVADRCEGALK